MHTYSPASLVLITVINATALAQSTKANWAECGSKEPDVSIRACTALLESEKATKENIAIALEIVVLLTPKKANTRAPSATAARQLS
jgi:hypothetical protein